MCHMLLLYICVAGIASASNLSEADTSTQNNSVSVVTPASVQLHGSEPISYSLSPTITTYSTVSQPIEDTAPLSHQIVASHIRCKCNKKKSDTDVKFGAHSVPQTDGLSSAVSQTEAVLAIGTSTQAPIDGSSAIYVATPVTSQETNPGYNGYDTSANKEITAPTAETYFTTFGGTKNVLDQRISTAAAGNNANVYPGTLGVQYFPNPALFAISPNTAQLYPDFPTPTNYHKTSIGPNFSRYNSPYVVNPYDPRLTYSPINPAAYNVNPALPNAAAGQNAAIQNGPNAGFVIYSTAPVPQPNSPIHTNSPIAYHIPGTISSTPRPIIYSGNTEPQNIAPQVGGAYGSYNNNAAPYLSAATSPRPIIINSGSPAVPIDPNQFAFSPVNDNRATNIPNYAVTGNPALSHTFPPGISTFSGPVLFANGPRSLSEKSVAVPVAQNYGTAIPGASTHAAPAKTGRIYSSAPEVSRVQFNGGGINYSW